MSNTASVAGATRNTFNEVDRNSRPAKVGKVLLLSSVPPSSKYTGALMLHSMCRALPSDKLACFAVLTSGMNSEIHPDWKGIPYVHRQKPSESQLRHFPLHLGVVESYLKEQATAKFATAKLTKEVLSFVFFFNFFLFLSSVCRIFNGGAIEGREFTDGDHGDRSSCGWSQSG